MALSYDSFYHPFGKGSSVFNFKPLIQKLTVKYFDHIKKDIYVSCVHNKQKDIYTFFARIPSERNNEFFVPIFFDVVLEFTPKNKAVRDEANLMNYDIRIFSNSPSFMFTFTYVLKNDKSLPNCLPTSVYSKLALRNAPHIKNKQELMTIEKTSWFLMFHLDYNGYLNKELISKITSREPERYFISKIMNQEKKLKEINEQDALLREDKRKNGSNVKQKYIDKQVKQIQKPLRGEDSITYNMRATNLSIGTNKVKALVDRTLKINKKFYGKLPKNPLKTNVLSDKRLKQK